MRQLLARLRADGTPDNAAAYLDELLDKLDSFIIEQAVFVPLAGIELPGEDLPLGNIVLRNITDEVAESLLRDIARITATTKHTDEEKAHITAHHRREVIENLRDKVCAEYRVVAEPSRAQERALEETHRALELLRYAIPALYPRDWHMVVGVVGEVGTVPRYTMSLSERSHYSSHKWVDPVRNLELTTDHLAHMAKIGVFSMADVLRKPSQKITSFERTLLHAIRLFAKAQTQADPESQLLHLMMCLETILTPKDRNPIGTSIGESIALIGTDGVEERLELKRDIANLYGYRSALSHGGKEAVLDADVSKLLRIAGALLMTMIQRKEAFTSRDDLLKWLELRRLGGAQDAMSAAAEDTLPG